MMCRTTTLGESIVLRRALAVIQAEQEHTR
jgi:hypothetical protein